MINYGFHHIDSQDIDAVIDVLQSNWLTCGPVVTQFEGALAQLLQVKYALACSNGTSALHLALLALDITVGDVVLVPAITFLASANAVRYVGAEVVFVDVDSDSGLMTPEILAQAFSQNQDKNIKAVINVHFAGQCQDLSALYEIARAQGVFVIEDAAHALGAEYYIDSAQSTPIGSCQFADITTFSFHPVKAIAMGEGGAITTNQSKLFDTIKALRHHGMVDSSTVPHGQKDMPHLGFNYRVSDINCALGLSQLGKLEVFKQQRTLKAAYYDHLLTQLPWITPLKKSGCSQPNWHIYVVLIDFIKLGKTREQVMHDLRSQGIATQIHYRPVYENSYYQNRYGSVFLSGVHTYYQRCLTLPLYVALTTEQQDQIVECLIQVCT